MNHRHIRFCCGTMLRAVHNPRFPIELGSTHPLYRLRLTPDGHAVIKHCPFCGHSLTEAGVTQLAVEGSADEMAEINQIATTLDRYAELQARLGDPTTSVELDNAGTTVRQHLYAKSWKTWHLYVHEHENGALDFTAVPVENG